jgi:hypothetical protein
VSNDVLAVVVGGAFVYLGTRAAAGMDRAVLLGMPVVAAIAVASKLTVWPAAAASVAGALAAARVSSVEARRVIAGLSITAVAALLVALGARLVFPLTAQAAIEDAIRRGSDFDRSVLAAETLWGLLRSTLMSAWGQFGWLTVDLPAWLYLAAGVVVSACFVSSLASLQHLSPAGRAGTIAALAACAAAAAAWSRNLLADPQPQGRLMFGALVAAAAVIAVGAAGGGRGPSAPLRAPPSRLRVPLLTGSLIAVLVASNVAALGWALPGAFARWRGAPPQVVLLTSRPNVVVAGRLIGEGALASQTFSTSSAAARVALAIHRAYGGGEAELRVLERDGTEVGRTRLTLDDLPPNTWVTVEIATPRVRVRRRRATTARRSLSSAETALSNSGGRPRMFTPTAPSPSMVCREQIYRWWSWVPNPTDGQRLLNCSKDCLQLAQ